MMTPDAEFKSELEVFRTEVPEGTQFFYSYLVVRAVADDHKPVEELLNRAPLFWNTVLAALQTSSLIVLERIFDQNSPHNLGKLFRIAQAHPKIFSKAALARRQQGNDAEPPEWQADYLRDVHEPTQKDFLRICTYICKWRSIYETNYQALRHKVFAHKQFSKGNAETAALFGKTNIRELERMFDFLNSLHAALRELFFNGRKPVLRPSRYSVKRMRDFPSPGSEPSSPQERITREVERFLKSASRVPTTPSPGNAG